MLKITRNKLRKIDKRVLNRLNMIDVSVINITK